MSAFESLGLHQALCTAVARLGFTEPTPIQKLTIPVLTSGTRDMVALAQTGTGKTAAFGLPAVQMCMENPFELQVLVLSPTRELCLQITADL
ncbi:MAG: DEAD/DEAH box helicase, partial [Bacteroidetes bacterium]|nr:DEAD/DEAH box helicase [Bacteroidota bacterium]